MIIRHFVPLPGRRLPRNRRQIPNYEGRPPGFSFIHRLMGSVAVLGPGNPMPERRRPAVLNQADCEIAAPGDGHSAAVSTDFIVAESLPDRGARVNREVVYIMKTSWSKPLRCCCSLSPGYVRPRRCM